ncbi:MAG TPA: hypothetical protein PK358_10845 [Spirochaetota bacterium]|nr:hypothetical protein [Spirochaetota bacterium]HPJ35324.1 hypothetical protein [Spirochaetota bacterium]
MTLQIPDGYEYSDKVFDLVSSSGRGYIFNPEDYDFTPRSTCTASHRGFRSVFGLNNGHLFLVQLDISLYSVEEEGWIPEKGMPLNGVEPEFGQSSSIFNNMYRNVNLPLDYSGTILIADEFVQELYVHIGFPMAWKYEKVIELTFKSGKLLQEEDRSDEMKILREKAEKSGDPFPDSIIEVKKPPTL